MLTVVGASGRWAEGLKARRWRNVKAGLFAADRRLCVGVSVRVRLGVRPKLRLIVLLAERYGGLAMCDSMAEEEGVGNGRGAGLGVYKRARRGRGESERETRGRG